MVKQAITWTCFFPLYCSNPRKKGLRELKLLNFNKISLSRGSAGRSEAGPGLGRDSQESREISAMQQRLNKTSTRVSAVNERSRHGHEKGAIKKQPQVCDCRSKVVGGTVENQS